MNPLQAYLKLAKQKILNTRIVFNKTKTLEDKQEAETKLIAIKSQLPILQANLQQVEIESLIYIKDVNGFNKGVYSTIVPRIQSQTSLTKSKNSLEFQQRKKVQIEAQLARQNRLQSTIDNRNSSIEETIEARAEADSLALSNKYRALKAKENAKVLNDNRKKSMSRKLESKIISLNRKYCEEIIKNSPTFDITSTQKTECIAKAKRIAKTLLNGTV